MAWGANLTNLNYVLAGLYPLTADSIRVVDVAGLPKMHIAFNARAIDNWHAILDEADKRGKVLDIIRAACRDYPDIPDLQRAERGQLTLVRGPVLDETEWVSQQPEGWLEQIMGTHSTLLPISFLEIGVRRAISVARVQRADGNLGSGFLTSNNIFVTNHHVIGSVAEARGAIIQFNYQQTASGLDMQATEFRLNPDAGFATSPVREDDWTLVRVQGDANSAWGAIELGPVDVKATEWVNIIQHPGGGPKQIALYHNVVTYADDRRVQYLTDTRPGSSGSPVFDSNWRVVALHHSGGWTTEPRAKSQFGWKKHVFRNAGVNINRVAQALEKGSLIS